MRINNRHRLVGETGQQVPFVATPNMGAKYSPGNLNHLIVHYTSGGTAAGAIDHFRKSTAEASAHIVIDHDGAVTQMVPFDTIAWHAGESRWEELIGLNKYSIGVEITNWGLLQRSSSGWKNRTGGSIDASRVIEARHKNFEPSIINGWEVYDPEQFESAYNVIKTIITHYNIPARNVIGHDDISPGRKQDPGPAFNLDRFRARLAGRAEVKDLLYEVNSPNGLYLRVGPEQTHSSIKLLADKTRVRVLRTEGTWWEVVVLDAAGVDLASGWVHSHWLRSV